MLFEKTIYPDDFPLNIQIIQVDEIPFHYHQDVELVYVLKGEIRLKNGYYNYLLKEGDIFTNSGHEVHGLRATDSDNVIAVIQISNRFFTQYFPQLPKACFRTYVNDDRYARLEDLRGMLLHILLDYTRRSFNYKSTCIYQMIDVIKYLIEYVKGNSTLLAEDGYFSGFISNGVSTELCFAVFCLITVAIIYAGVRNGIERVSKVMMPILIVLSVIIAVYSVTRPGALAGVKYFLVPNLKNFSWMSVVAAMGQMFYSLSIAMGILITFGSYMKKETAIEDSTRNVEVFDTAIAIMAGLMIIPAVFAFSGGDPDTLQAGPSLMFITIPKVFANMGFGTVIGILFFLLVLFAALTSSIALTESAVSTFEDELGWGRKKSTVLIGVIMIALGTLSCLGYGPLSSVTILGMQFLDFFDFLTNSVMMPIAAIATCLLVSRVIGVAKIEEEIIHGESRFRRKKIFLVMIQYLCPVFALIILFSSVANAFGWITM